jgi:single-strand DNA-binding protein
LIVANDLNQCNFIGRLGADPEMRYMPSGDAVASFRLAVGWKTKEKEGTEWVPVTAFGKLGEICGQYLKKGAQVFVSCRARTEEYEKGGEKRYITKFVADTMQMLGSRGDGAGAGSGSSAPASRPSARPAPPPGDDDLPF